MQESIHHKQNLHQSMHSFAGLKRFFERWSADPGFKQALIDNAADTLAKNHIPVIPGEIEAMLVENTVNIPEPVMKMWAVAFHKQEMVKSFYLTENLPRDTGMLAWRNRQIARQRFDLGPFFTSSNIHSSLAIELSAGCSVGCWFCALSPDTFKEYYDYTKQEKQWKSFIKNMHHFLGDAMKSTFLYWATEPFDNPDYEDFCLDVYEECGVFPPTTTALAHKFPDRIRKFIKFSSEYQCWLNRFSLTSLGIMQKVHQEFTAEELAEVECLALNKSANFAFGNSGDFRKRVLKTPELLAEQDSKLRKAPWHQSNPSYADSEDYANGSICCVTGFLVNMVTQKIQLISSTTATDEWPLGYIIFSEESFSSPSDLPGIFKKLQTAHFKEQLCDHDPISFQPWLQIEVSLTEVLINGRFKQTLAVTAEGEKDLYCIVRIIKETPGTFKAIQERSLQKFSISKDRSHTLIHQLFNQGFFYGH